MGETAQIITAVCGVFTAIAIPCISAWVLLSKAHLDNKLALDLAMLRADADRAARQRDDHGKMLKNIESLGNSQYRVGLVNVCTSADALVELARLSRDMLPAQLAGYVEKQAEAYRKLREHDEADQAAKDKAILAKAKAEADALVDASSALAGGKGEVNLKAEQIKVKAEEIQRSGEAK